MKTSFFIYILKCQNDSYYTCYTDNLERRYQKHCEGLASKYTRSFKPVCIAQSWEIKGTKAEAMKIERYIKNLTRAEKENLIKNPKKLTTK